MSKTVVVLLAVVALFSIAGCHTKPIAVLETAATELIRPDGVVSSFFWFGPWSDEFQDSWQHQQSMYRSYHKDLKSIVDDYDKHFLRYDKYDPFAE